MKKRFLSMILALALIFSFFLPVIPVKATKSQDKEVELPKELIMGTNNEGRTLNFNQGWKFKRSFVKEALKKDYSLIELQKWENVNLPHTVRLEKYSNSGIDSIYSGDAMYIKHFPIMPENNGKKIYIRFEGVMGTTDVYINGVKMHTEIANTTGTNTWYGGYLPFVIDITDHVICDGKTENVIAVYANNKIDPLVPPGRDPSRLDFSYFGGIYRNVNMIVTDRVHITDANFENIVAGGGILVDFPNVSDSSADVDIKTHVRNENSIDSQVILKSELIDKDGVVVGESSVGAVKIEKNGDYTFSQRITVQNPKLWNLKTPYLHTLKSSVIVDGVVKDTVSTKIGIRKIELHRSFGLKINGEVQDFLNGVNRHQEYAYIGYAAPRSLQIKDALKFKEAGINVVRTAHYPADPAFLEACDELGILILEPTPGWQHYVENEIFKTRVYNDIRQMVRRDRNHASILAFETVLNETAVPSGFTLSLARVAKEEHPSAKCATENSVKDGEKDPVSDIMYRSPENSDFAVGFQREYGDSYREQYSTSNFFFRRVHRGFGMPWAFYPGGEGAMFMQAVKRLQGNQRDTPYYCPVDAANSANGGSYDAGRSYLDHVEKSNARENSNGVRLIGATSWISIDHNRSYANDMSACGLWDLMRIPKFAYYAMASQRSAGGDATAESFGLSNGPMVFISSFWTEKAPVMDKTNESFKTLGTDSSRIIVVYGNTQKVKLSVVSDAGSILWSETHTPMTGKNRQLINAPFQFLNVPYSKGSHLVAEGLSADGIKLTEHKVYTAGAPTQVTLTPDTMGMDFLANGSDTLMLYGYVRDKDGNVCNNAYNQMKFTVVSGDAKIVGDGIRRVGSNPVKAEAGIFGVYLQAGTTAGDIVIRIESEGLKSSEITIKSKADNNPTSPYYKIAYTGSIEDESLPNSNFLSAFGYDIKADKNQIKYIKKDNITIGKTKYDRSVIMMNNNSAIFNLDGYLFNNIKGAVTVLDIAKEKSSAEFFILVDDMTVWKSGDVMTGDIVPFNVNIPNGRTIELKVRSNGRDYDDYLRYAFLSPYVTEGDTVLDESELSQNVALMKPAEVSSTIDGSKPNYANDGDVSTTWIGDLVNEGVNANPQYLTVDLLEEMDLRGAKVGVLHDSIHYTYDIQVSKNNKDFTTVKTVTKSGQNNDVDYFDAKGVRYVRIYFKEIETYAERDQYSNATITELEIYRDFGIKSVSEIYLNSLIVNNHNLPFNHATKNYTLNLYGYESKLNIKASAFDSSAKISVNGVEYKGDWFALSELPNDNTIRIVVTSANGNATCEYTIKVVGELGSFSYDNAALTMGDRNQTGETRWHYQQFENGKFVDIMGSPVYASNQPYYGYQSASWTRMGSTFAHPGKEMKVSRTYYSEKDGIADIELFATKFVDYSGMTQFGEVGISIFKNNEKIFPEDSAKALCDANTNVYVKLKNMDLKAGDKIYFVVDNYNGSNASDATFLDTTICYKGQSQIQVDKFLINNSVILGKSVETVKTYDRDAVNSAINEYNKLNTTQKSLLRNERILLENLKYAISVLDGGKFDVAGIEMFTKKVNVGEKITLPQFVNIYMTDGSEKAVKVTWSKFDETLIQKEGSFRLEGTVDGYTIKTYYGVVVSNSDANVSCNPSNSGLPMAFASYSNIKAAGAGGDFVKLVNDGVVETRQNWTTYGRQHQEDWLGILFGSGSDLQKQEINKIDIKLSPTGTSATQPPEYIKIQYYVGPDFKDLPADQNNLRGTNHPLADDRNWKDATVLSQTAIGSNKTVTINISTVTSLAVRAVMKPKTRPNGSTSSCLGVVEFTCYSKKAGNNIASIEGIQVNGQNLDDFNVTKTEYTYKLSENKIPDVKAVLTDNSLYSVIKPLTTGGKIRIVVSAEGGDKTVYSIKLDNSDFVNLSIVKSELIDEISNLQNLYKRENYFDVDFFSLNKIIGDAKVEIQGINDIKELEKYSINELKVKLDSVKKKDEYVNKEGFLSAFNISLNGSIGLNFRFNLAKDYLKKYPDSFVEFRFVNGEISKQFVKDASVDIEGRYVFTVYLDMAEMTDKVTFKLVLGDGQVGETYAYSIRDYCDLLFSNPSIEKENPGVNELAKAMLNLGGFAQIYFNYRTDALANEGIYNDVDNPVLNGKFDSVNKINIVQKLNNLKFKSYSLSMQESTVIRLYFILDADQAIDDFKFKLTRPDGSFKNIKPVLDKGKYRIDIADVTAPELDDNFTLEVTCAEGVVCTIEFNAICYADKVLILNSNKNLINLMKALKIYSNCANAYKFEK